MTATHLARTTMQALGDVSLPPAARLMMFHLDARLDCIEYREQKYTSLAHEMGVKQTTVGKMLDLLVQRGYLAESGKKKPRAFRMPLSRRTSVARAA
jgi:DNA-binding MarR family transcriptional regulator